MVIEWDLNGYQTWHSLLMNEILLMMHQRLDVGLLMMLFMSLPRFERWRRSRRPGNTRRKSKRKRRGRCTSYRIHWNQTSLLICGRNSLSIDLISSRLDQSSLPPEFEMIKEEKNHNTLILLLSVVQILALLFI